MLHCTTAKAPLWAAYLACSLVVHWVVFAAGAMDHLKADWSVANSGQNWDWTSADPVMTRVGG